MASPLVALELIGFGATLGSLLTFIGYRAVVHKIVREQVRRELELLDKEKHEGQAA